MRTPPPANSRRTPPEFDYFADVVMRFVDATESLLQEEMSHQFNIGSAALRDCAARFEHEGTLSKQTLLTLATQQVDVGHDQCDLLRGIAAAARADRVTLAPFPLARTSAVIAAKAWYVLTADSRQERLRRYLNEQLAALYDSPLPYAEDEEENDDDVVAEAVKFRDDRTTDYLAVGATADLTPVYRKKPRPWEPPFFARPDQAATTPSEPAQPVEELYRAVAPPSEKQLMKDLYQAAGLQTDQLAGFPYSLLSAATHGRFRQAGLVTYVPTGSPSVGGVRTTARSITLGVMAQSTVYAALATRTYLCALARYTAVSEEVVLNRLRQPAAEWLAITPPAAD